MSPDSLDGLEDVHFAVLDDLLDAGVGGAVHPGAAASVPARTRHINTYYKYTHSPQSSDNSKTANVHHGTVKVLRVPSTAPRFVIESRKSVIWNFIGFVTRPI